MSNNNVINNVVIGDKFDNYFNNLIHAPPKTDYTVSTNISSFYKNYVEHNLIIIFILIGICIYLYFRYLSNQELIKQQKIYEIKQRKMMKVKKVSNEEQMHIEQKIAQMREYDLNLKRERERLLKIIDEISSINDEKQLEELYNTINGQAYNNEPEIQNLESDYMHNGIVGSQNGSYQMVNENAIKENYINGNYVDTPYR